MKVTNVTTTHGGTQLAVYVASNWLILDDPSAPSSVDALVHGGDAARKRVEEALVRSGRPANGNLALCVPRPRKILCVGLNYRRHAREAGLEVPTTPVLFGKFDNSLVPAGHPVSLPRTAEQYDYESELGVVIGRRATAVSENDALRYVWGYCNCNDLSARDLQSRTTQVTLGKILDGFLPVGPMLVSSDEVGDPQNLVIRGWHNGELRQHSNTSDMLFSVAELVSYISNYLPLEPGDLLSTGTPEGVILGRESKAWIKPGDVAEVEIGPLGRLTTDFVAARW